MISIYDLEIRPQHFPRGVTLATLTYKGKSYNGTRTVEVEYHLDGGNDIWFIEEGVKTKTLGPDEIVLTESEKMFVKEIGIEVETEHNPPLIAYIEVIAKDEDGNTDRTSDSITYG